MSTERTQVAISDADFNVFQTYLERIVADTPEDRRDQKIYHEGQESYSFPELLAEVNGQTPFGISYMSTVLNRAQRRGVSLHETILVLDLQLIKQFL